MTRRRVPSVRLPVPKPPLEKVEQAHIIGLLNLCGWEATGTSQYRASHLERGIADLYATHERLGWALWWETKPYQPKGWMPLDPSTWRLKPLSADQEKFRDRLLRARQLWGWGALKDCQDFLCAVGLGRWEGILFRLEPHRGSPEMAAAYLRELKP